MTMPKIIEETLDELLVRDATLMEKYVPKELFKEGPPSFKNRIIHVDPIDVQHMTPPLGEDVLIDCKSIIIDDILCDKTFREIINL